MVSCAQRWCALAFACHTRRRYRCRLCSSFGEDERGSRFQRHLQSSSADHTCASHARVDLQLLDLADTPPPRAGSLCPVTAKYRLEQALCPVTAKYSPRRNYIPP